MYGWYSLDAYLRGDPEFVYINPDGQETYCTATSYTKKCPYHLDQYPDCIFMGEIKYYMRSITN